MTAASAIAQPLPSQIRFRQGVYYNPLEVLIINMRANCNLLSCLLLPKATLPKIPRLDIPGDPLYPDQ